MSYLKLEPSQKAVSGRTILWKKHLSPGTLCLGPPARSNLQRLSSLYNCPPCLLSLSLIYRGWWMRAMALHSSLGQVQNEEWLWDKISGLRKRGFQVRSVMWLCSSAVSSLHEEGLCYSAGYVLVKKKEKKKKERERKEGRKEWK